VEAHCRIDKTTFDLFAEVHDPDLVLGETS
jgi:hypothetical protein